jgi:hypothetical protein
MRSISIAPVCREEWDSPAGLFQQYKELFLNASWKSSDCHLLNRSNIVRWNRFVPTVNKPEMLRWILHQNQEHLSAILESIDATTLDTHKPTHHFREWVQGTFYAEEETEAAARTLYKETQEYRDHFGMSVGHACGGCNRNEPCDICGKSFPLDHYTGEINEAGHHVTISAAGKRSSNLWQTRCSNQLTCNIGLHVCGACGAEFTYFRKELVKRAILRRKNAHKTPHKLRHYQNKSTAFSKFECVGGRFKGEWLQLTVEQNGALASSRDALLDEEEHPLEINLMHHSNTGTVVLDWYNLGSGRKSSNGCSKMHREDLSDRRALKRQKREREEEKEELLRSEKALCAREEERKRRLFFVEEYVLEDLF